MGYIFVTPDWFFGYDIALELLFVIIAGLVSFYAWKIFKVTGERNLKLFSLAFLFIAFSYVVQSVLNILVLAKFDDDVAFFMNLRSVYLFSLFAIYLQAILFLIGLLLLAYIALKIFSLQTFVLLFILVFTSLYFSPYKTFMLYLLSTVLLGFIVYYYLNNYWNNRKATTLMVLIAMIFLFVSNLSFIFATDIDSYYVVGHLLELAAYVLVLTNLLVILRVGKQKHKNGKKTR